MKVKFFFCTVGMQHCGLSNWSVMRSSGTVLKTTLPAVHSLSPGRCSVQAGLLPLRDAQLLYYSHSDVESWSKVLKYIEEYSAVELSHACVLFCLFFPFFFTCSIRWEWGCIQVRHHHSASAHVWARLPSDILPYVLTYLLLVSPQNTLCFSYSWLVPGKLSDWRTAASPGVMCPFSWP